MVRDARRQLLLAVLDEPKPVVLPPGVATRAARAMGTLLLQISRAEHDRRRGVAADGQGGTDDRQP